MIKMLYEISRYALEASDKYNPMTSQEFLLLVGGAIGGFLIFSGLVIRYQHKEKMKELEVKSKAIESLKDKITDKDELVDTVNRIFSPGYEE